MSVSRSGRSLKSKTLEWPPRCPTGRCDVRKGCLCTHDTSAASAYFDCAAQIHGPDAPGMPTARPEVAPSLTKVPRAPPPQEETPPPTKRPRGRPPGSVSLARRQKKLELQLALQSPTLIVDMEEPLASPDTLMLLFTESRDENAARHSNNIQRREPHTVANTDLFCDESPVDVMDGRVKKRVRWTGLPAEPPEWVTGIRRKVPRLWQPCVHAVVTDGLLCLRDRRADESRIVTLPTQDVNVCWK